jgi:hypothetical protein
MGEPCIKCGGSGESDCSYCNGSGLEGPYDCDQCRGSGKESCPRCGGANDSKPGVTEALPRTHPLPLPCWEGD